jgi:putative tricarboxylic transport membrane protein
MFGGAMPGMTATMTMALLLGFTLQFPPTIGLSILIGVYGAAIFAGSITAVMINIPGTPASAATVFDGFTMAKKGRPREALGSVILASFLGEVSGQVLALICLPIIAVFALQLGDWETFIVGIIGITLAGSLAGSEPTKGWIAGFIGFLIAMVGIDPIYGVPRFAYTLELQRGIQYLPALIGLFGISEVIYVLKDEAPYQITGSPGRAITVWREFKRLGSMLRSIVIGFGIGLIPGVGESASCFVAYDFARRNSKQSEKFGTGIHEGIIAPELAKDATGGGAIVPALVLGIPGSGPTAVLISALLLYDIPPGPRLIVDHPGFIGQIVAMFILSALAFRILAFLLSSHIIRLLSIPREILLPAAGALGLVGAWGTGFTIFDIWVALGFGVLGYFMRLRNYPMAPMVLGLLVGPIVDQSFRRALITYSDNLTGMLLRPIGIGLTVFLIIMLYLVLRGKKTRGNTA